MWSAERGKHPPAISKNIRPLQGLLKPPPSATSSQGPPQVLERGSLLQINVYLLNPKDVDPCPPQPGAHTTPE